MTMRQQAMSGSYRRGEQGFTLIELMFVVVIIGIIVAFAIPSYQDYMTKSRRSDAKTLLMDIAAREEQYFLDNRSYTSALGNLGYSGLNADLSVNTANGYYKVSVTSTTTTFTLTAAPQGAQSGDTCGSLTLTEAGVRDATVNAPGATAAEIAAIKATCW